MEQATILGLGFDSIISVSEAASGLIPALAGASSLDFSGSIFIGRKYMGLGMFSLVKVTESPYLTNAGRLADVIAAIQALGVHKKYKCCPATWADRICGDDKKADYWQKIFEEHPEFFRFDSKRELVSLIWRRQHQKRFDARQEKTISREEYYALDGARQREISRLPLASNEVAMLIEAAINLHQRSLENRKDQRWLIAALIGLLGVVLGAWIS